MAADLRYAIEEGEIVGRRDRERKTERKRQGGREIERQTDRQREGGRDRQTNRQTDTHTVKEKGISN